MHIHFEKAINAYSDCTILSMSWMGKVPDELPEDEGWKLNRTHYYQEGWLATGNVRGVLGVTYTTSQWKNNASEVPLRTNYNLRGHRSQITLVQWNEPYQKLASCDSSGIIFVWIKFEGRWSIELINDRNTPVTHFSWSHDGRMALICYQDNFVLVGSVAGQRYWSTLLNLESTITCGIWTPDDQQVYFGTTNGQVVVMDVHGVMLSQIQLPSDSPISAMAWSCEKFKMEESEDGEAASSSNHYCNKHPFLLAVCFKTGGIYLMKGYDDVVPIYVATGMHGLHIEWSNSGEFLAVAGSRPIEVLHENGNRVKEYSNSLHVYNHQGIRIINIAIPNVLSPVTSMTWGHNDKRIFIATGKLTHVGWISKRIASLQLLCRLAIYKSLNTETCVSHLPLPLPVRALISSLHTQTIPSLLPNMKDLRDFVSHPPNSNLRLYCTMIRHDEDANQSPGTAYTLYLEYMGGLIPILKGKRTSKIRPEFVIYDPQSTEGRHSSLLTQQHGLTEDSNGNGGIDSYRISANSRNCCRCSHQSHQHHHLRQVKGNENLDGYYGHSTNSSSSSCSTVANGSEMSCGSGKDDNGPEFCNNHCQFCQQQNPRRISTLVSEERYNDGPKPRVSLPSNASTTGSIAATYGFSDSSESEDVELCASPRMQRKRYRNRQRERERLLEREREREWERTREIWRILPEPTHPHQLIYNDVLPESARLVEVTSNIWGTKFKIHGVSPSLPDNLGQVSYKTSLLHLQPRQMTLLITELRDDIFFTPESLAVHGSYVDDDEEDLSVIVGGPDPSALAIRSLTHYQTHHQMGEMQSGSTTLTQNGISISGSGFRGNIYTGSNVIYHPQGVPRGEDSPPIISTNRCYLQSSSTLSSSSNVPLYTGQQCQLQSSCDNSSSFLQGTSSPSLTSPQHQLRNPESYSSSSVASSSSSQSANRYYASSSSSTTHFGVDDHEEFPYADLTPNSDIIHYRERLASPSVVSTSSVSVAGVGREDTATETIGYPTERCIQRMKEGLTITGNGDASGGYAYCSEGVVKSPKHLPRALRAGNGVGINAGAGAVTAPPPQLHSHSHSVYAENGKPAAEGYCSAQYRPQQQHNVKTVPVTAPFVRRSISASFLDSVDRNIAVALDIVGNEQAQPPPPKRLVLVKRRELEKCDEESILGSGVGSRNAPRLKDWGKSKSWDSWDLSGWKTTRKLRDNSREALLRAGGGITGDKLLGSAYKHDISTNACPKCRFPSTEPSKNSVVDELSLLNSRGNIPYKIPGTPTKRNVKRNTNSSGSGPLSNLTRTSDVENTQIPNTGTEGEDIIERVAEFSPIALSNPVPVPGSPAPSRHASQSPPTSLHRRSLSLLTPLLKRREILNSGRQQQSSAAGSMASTTTPKQQRRQCLNDIVTTNNMSTSHQSTTNAPHSSSFIPPGSPQHQPRSNPSTPGTIRRSKQSYFSSASSPFRQLFINSPLLRRRKSKSRGGSGNGLINSFDRSQESKQQHITDSSDEEDPRHHHLSPQVGGDSSFQRDVECACTRVSVPSSSDNCVQDTPFRDSADMMHRTLIHQKMCRRKVQCMEPCIMTSRRREFLMHNKAPMWNENSQVYQLDFGGRVTQESAKNFQIEFRGKQVMQFGRIDGSAYTLDFQYPFAAVQAFSVALANVTQRLK